MNEDAEADVVVSSDELDAPALGAPGEVFEAGIPDCEDTGMLVKPEDDTLFDERYKSEISLKRCIRSTSSHQI